MWAIALERFFRTGWEGVRSDKIIRAEEIRTINKHRRPLAGHQTNPVAVRHRRPPARASPRSIPPLPQERNASLVARPRPHRCLSPPQQSAPSLAAGAGGEEAAHKPSRRARPHSRRAAAMAWRRCCAIDLALRGAAPSVGKRCVQQPATIGNCFLVPIAQSPSHSSVATLKARCALSEGLEAALGYRHSRSRHQKDLLIATPAAICVVGYSR